VHGPGKRVVERAGRSASRPLWRLVRLAAGWLQWLVLCGSASAVIAGTAADTAADPALEARVNAVSAELRCLVCQNQTLADSHAPLAIDLKNQVREQLRAGRSAEQVVDYMTERYGDFVRYRPPWKATTLPLWLGPLALLLGGGVLLWREMYRHTRHQGALDLMSAVDSERAVQLLAEPSGIDQASIGGSD
jgi:cytochrome c-type biogenesis protein CcmH